MADRPKITAINGDLQKQSVSLLGWGQAVLLNFETLGILDGIALVAVYKDGGIAINHEATNLGAMIGALEVLKHEIINDINNGVDDDE